MDILYKKSTSIYNLHSYWTKQPVDAIKKFISVYTKEDDVVLDPFCGSGMTGVASNQLNRNSILGDISNICIHISKGYTNNFENIDANEVKKFISDLKCKLKDYINTNCIYCNKSNELNYQVIGEQYIFNKKLYDENEKLFEATLEKKTFKSNVNKDYKFKQFISFKYCYKCDCRKTKIYKELDKKDKKIQSQLARKNIEHPNNDFFGKEPKRNYKKNVFKVRDLYSNLNLYLLNTILESIYLTSSKNNDLKNFLLFNFSSILFNCSLMSRLRHYENTSIAMGTYYIPRLIKDNNPIKSFEKKIYNHLKYIKKHSFVNKSKIINQSATKLNLKQDSIDFIYTDPPYLDLINYSELNLVFESWLNIKSNYAEEMVVNGLDNKDINYYLNNFIIFLNESSRVLKKDRYMVLIFHHPEKQIWKLLQEIIIKSKFKLYLDNKPTRLLSFNKTSSQRKTNKNTQSFICLTLKNKKKIEKIKLKNLNKLTEKKINKEAISYGYESKSDNYDYFINYCLKNNYLIN